MISTHLAIKFRANAPLMTETVPSGLAVPNLSAHSDGHDTRMAPDGCHLRVDQRVQNAGIVSEPGHRSRRYSVALNRTADLCLSPDDGLAQRCKRRGPGGRNGRAGFRRSRWLDAYLRQKWTRLTRNFRRSAVLAAPMFFRSEAIVAPGRLRNRTFDELELGDTASLVRVAGVDKGEIDPPMATGEGDASPDTAAEAMHVFNSVVTNGAWTGTLISEVLGSQLPGPGTTYLGQEFRFLKPVLSGDTITATVRVTRKLPANRVVILDTTCSNQKGEEVLSGTATVIAPAHSIEWPTPQPSGHATARSDRYDAFVRQARELPMVRAAIVHPCSTEAILAAVEVRERGLFEPLLVGPEAKIRAAAAVAKTDLDGIAIEHAPHSHAAAARAVELAVSGRVAVLVKGSLHTDELLGAIVAPGSGLRTERRISHVFALDVPAYSKPLIVTDAAINIQPTLDQKRDICQNAVGLLRALGVEKPRVAVLAAVETVNLKMQATLDAAALTVMAARSQITGAYVDGPLAFDNAISIDAARTKGIVSEVAGKADILLVPDLEAGNMLAKQLIYFAGATAAGIVLGARVPIVLTSRSDPLAARIVSAALAKLLVGRSERLAAGTAA